MSPDTNRSAPHPWQARQASLISHYASMDYLQGALRHVERLVAYATGSIDPAWAHRLDALVALRGREIWGMTDVGRYSRALDAASPLWGAPRHVAAFETLLEEAARSCANIDQTVDPLHGWNPAACEFAWREARVPERRFRVRRDVAARSGEPPPRTGAYLPQDDPCGAVQWAWTGDAAGRLRTCETLDDIAADAIRTFGWESVWGGTAAPRLARFLSGAHREAYAAFVNLVDPYGGSYADPRYANAFVQLRCGARRDCDWHWLEPLDGGPDGPDPLPEALAPRRFSLPHA